MQEGAKGLLAVSSQMHKCILREGWEWKLKEQLFFVLCVAINVTVCRRCCKVKIFLSIEPVFTSL
jgi:hypothetical protein